jgi:ParB-like chromosome segregation protein Spo0J
MVTKKPKGLGLGLEALLGPKVSTRHRPTRRAATTLKLTQLQPGKYQPRTRMDEGSLYELAESIKSQGVMQPILVRPVGAGAATRSSPASAASAPRNWPGWTRCRCWCKEVPDEAAAAMALIENIQREDLNPLEEAQGLKRLVDEFGLTHEQAAQAVGRSRSAASNLLRLLNLAAPVQQMLMAGDLDMGHARALLPLDAGFAARYDRTREEELSLEEYLDECRRDPLTYASAAERMLKAIGEPQTVDTRNDPRLSRLFANKVIKIYPAFAEFYGMEDSIEQVVSYFRHAAQGLEEKKQILYLLGPVGGGKSSIAERLKALMQEVPFYAIKGSPVNESPLGLFDAAEDGDILEKEYGIPRRYLNRVLSPWAVKRLEEFGGDIRRFRVVKRYPSILKQVGIAKTEPGDENNQDISSLVGKVDIRKLETYAQDDPTPTAFPAACAWPTRVCSNSSRCSRRRSRCCTRC